MKGTGIVTIHGKEYMTVAKRLELAHEDSALQGVETEILNHNPIVIRAKVTINDKVFTGISSVSLDSSRNIERENPYEVAETSAVGRALGFAGYGLIESVASADEMVQTVTPQTDEAKDRLVCEKCGKPAMIKKGKSKTGKEYQGIFCITGDRTHTKWLWNSAM